MTSPDAYPGLPQILGHIKANALDLARQRCSKAACGLCEVVLVPSPLTKRVPGSNVVWMDDMVHAIACATERTCHYTENPNDITAVFTQAIHITLNELGLVGLVDSPDVLDTPENN